MQVLQRCFRVYSSPEGFNASLQFYERLQGVSCERRGDIPETIVAMAKVGGVLTLAGDESELDGVRHVAAIFYVDDLDSARTWLEANDAEVVHPPRTISAGRNLTARRPDGLVVKYFESGRRS